MNLKLVVVLLGFLCISQAYPRNHRRQDGESADEDLEKQIEEEFEELLKDEGRLRKGGKENQSGGGRGEGRLGNKGPKRPSSTAEPDQNDRPARPETNGERPKPSDMPVMPENRRRAYEESVDEDLEKEIEEELEDFLKGEGSSRKGGKEEKLGGGKDKDSGKGRMGNKRPKRPSSTAEPDQNDRPARPETNGKGPKPSDMPVMPENRRRAYEESVDEDLEKEIEEEIEDFLKGKGSSRKGSKEDKLGGGKDKDSGKGRMGNKRPKRPHGTAEPDTNGDRPENTGENGGRPENPDKSQDKPEIPEENEGQDPENRPSEQSVKRRKIALYRALGSLYRRH
ncbi:translation initiation factor IF-2-like [Mytilus californianus]|uniref:translation initiation factor IF-2-like n=1 Tax=Mytilus californianus TaxID=6549 RepID=UPI002247695B|nr:translation initiation factor IF-2-like [Mytilus californianus]